MRTIALVGFGESNKAAFSLPPEIEVWSVNHAHKLGFRIDRLIDIHPWELIRSDNYYQHGTHEEYLKFLAENTTIPVYMQEQYPEIPASKRYPIEDAAALSGPPLSSTFPYLAAMAVIEGVDRVEIYGFDMVKGTEYEYQRADALSWIWYMRGRGMDVYIPPECGLYVERRLYGYEGVQMVARQTLENHLDGYKRQFDVALAEMHQIEGRLIEARKLGEARRKMDELAHLLRLAEVQVARTDGAIQSIQHLIDTCDLVEVAPSVTADKLYQEGMLV